MFKGFLLHNCMIHISINMFLCYQNETVPSHARPLNGPLWKQLIYCNLLSKKAVRTPRHDPLHSPNERGSSPQAYRNVISWTGTWFSQTPKDDTVHVLCGLSCSESSYKMASLTKINLYPSVALYSGCLIQRHRHRHRRRRRHRHRDRYKQTQTDTNTDTHIYKYMKQMGVSVTISVMSAVDETKDWYTFIVHLTNSHGQINRQLFNGCLKLNTHLMFHSVTILYTIPF